VANVDDVIEALRSALSDLEDIEPQHGDDCACSDCDWLDAGDDDEWQALAKEVAEEVQALHLDGHEGLMQWCIPACKKAHEVLEHLRAESY
jgi:hypothetical protein